MDSDQGKLFIGGISWETTEEKLKEYFENYGEVIQTVVMREKFTGRPRGFGFVVFSDPAVLDRVLQDTHTLDGRTVEAKRALSREEQQTSGRAGNPNPGRNGGGAGNTRTKKIFVGGLPATLAEEGFREYFETYGHVTDVVVMYDQNTGRPRGFGFISFDSEDAVERVLHKTFHDLNGKQVEVKRALPKDANPGGGGGRGGGGGYQGYGGSGGNPNSYDRVDSSRFMQPQNAGGAFPPYGASGYGAPGYGYGGYGSYGAPSAAYGAPTGPNAAYASGQSGARSSWNAQAPGGYGMGYGGAGPWGVAGGGANPGAAAPTVQSPSAAGYGNPAYAYGSYGGADGSYGRSGNTPNSGAEYGNAYNDANGNAGYGNAAWRSDQSQGAGNYGAGQANGAYGGAAYGAAPARQAQQQ